MCRGAVHRPAMAAPLILATKSFTEQHILGDDRTVPAKERFSGAAKTNIATVISRNAMINKQIDMTGSTPARR